MTTTQNTRSEALLAVLLAAVIFAATLGLSQYLREADTSSCVIGFDAASCEKCAACGAFLDSDAARK